ncbi:hypothetical protein POTOM_006771 [Populus tomentosa]|uniref:Aminotransferase-like plant mobile domain-containing protein n=1 Tax=Populus tomentosa TaxID=118781 RepID=A0A8X8AJU7_POPTO|nr:hypothetical protein POTOM_006771 [Populus tomentosa]
MCRTCVGRLMLARNSHVCEALQGIHDGLTVELWSSMQLVQVGVWKRFGELRRPEPNLIRSGYPSFMEKKKCGPATVGSSLKDDLMAFARRVRISMLCGVGCSEQYLPHRVAMQFGTDEDLSGLCWSML